MAAPSYPPAAQGSVRSISKKPTKHSHSAPLTSSATMSSQPPPMLNRRGSKRPRPFNDSNMFDSNQPATVIRKKEGMKSATSSANTSPSKDGSANAFKKGMYLSCIDDAFQKRQQGQNDRYKELIAQFQSLIPSSNLNSHFSASSSSLTSTTTPSSSALRIWLEALNHIVSKLDETHAPLVDTILAVPWATMDDQFVAAYVRFIGSLVSARPEWLRLVLDRTVKGFRYRSNYTIGSPASMPSMTRRTLYARLHALLKLLISLIPTLSPTLAPLLAVHFPSKREPRFSQICYIDNLLALTEYCSALTEDVLTLIIERALNIDVEIQGEPDDWEEAEEEMLANDKTKLTTTVKDIVDRLTAEDDDADSSDEDDDGGDGGLDLDDLDSDDEPNPVSDDEAARMANKGDNGMSPEAIRKVLENRIKLDAILKVLFDHLAALHATSPPSPQPDNSGNDSTETTPTPESRPPPALLERRMTLFRTLLDIFDRTLLRTFKTRNTQFVLFYLCSLEVSSSDQFIGVLLGRALFETDAPAITRVAAAGYVASFISRAKFVDANMTRKVVHHLCRYLEGAMEDFLASNAGSTKGALAPGLASDLPVFYSVAQAVFYIFCFRWKDLMDEGEDDELVLEPGRRWMLGLETIKKAVSSSFNPLKVCAQPIVTQFAAIANKTNFLYCYSIIDSNRRAGARESNSAPVTPSLASSAATAPRIAPIPPSRSSSVSSIPSAAPRQLLVAEEMDSFFPFDPFKLPLSSIYIDDIYREWNDEDDGTSSDASSETDSSSDDLESDTDDSQDDIDTETEMGGLAVPGLSTSSDPAMDEEVARSFEAMSLSLSPNHESFGGRRRKDQEDRLPPISSLA